MLKMAADLFEMIRIPPPHRLLVYSILSHWYEFFCYLQFLITLGYIKRAFGNLYIKLDLVDNLSEQFLNQKTWKIKNRIFITEAAQKSASPPIVSTDVTCDSSLTGK